MAKNKSIIPVIVVIGLVLLLLGAGIGSYFYFTGSSKFVPQTAVEGQTTETIPQYCYPKEAFTTVGSKKCDPNSAGCEVTVTLKCLTQSENVQTVIQRVSSYNYHESGSWIVLRNEYGQLESWYRASVISGNPPAGESPQDLVNTWKYYKAKKAYGGNMEDVLVVPNDDKYTVPPASPSQWTNHLIFRKGGSGNTNPTPIANCQNTEVCTGTNPYFCEQCSTGDLKLCISYSSKDSWTKTNSGTLPAGKTINWVGDITGNTAYQRESQCRYDMPHPSDTTKYYSCGLDEEGCGVLAPSSSDCPTGTVFIEQYHACKPPFDVVVTTTKQAYAQAEPIEGKVELKNTPNVDQIPIDVYLYDLAGTQKSFKSGKTDSSGKFSFTLGAQAVGQYDIKVTVKHPLKTFTTPATRVSIAQGMNLVLYPENNVQNTGDVKIYAIVTDIAGTAKTDITNFDFTGSSCGTKDAKSWITWAYKSVTSRGAEYTITANVPEPCQFTFKVVAIDSQNYNSQPPQLQGVRVEKSTVTIEPMNENQLMNLNEGSYTYKFMVLNEKRQPITPQLITIRLQEKGGCFSGEACTAQGSRFFGTNIPAIVAQGTSNTGEYSFTTRFYDGLNYLFITASADGLSDNTYDTSLYFWDVPDDDTCPTGQQKCSDGTCSATCEGGNGGGFPTSLVVTGVLVVIVVGFFLLIIFRRKKK